MRKKPTEQTLKKLFALSGNQCAFPNCTHSIIDANDQIIADICHIEAAQKGGERYNPMQDDDARASFENLILLCATHHRATNETDKFTIQSLRKMKIDHENKFKAQPYSVSSSVITSAIEILSRGDVNIKGEVQNITINQGLGLEDATALFKQLFEANFPKLQDLAKQAAIDNVAKLDRIFHEKAQTKLKQDDLVKFSDPDLQYILNKAIETAARKDSVDLRENLSNLLIKRIQLNSK
jgi:hypothetical protein